MTEASEVEALKSRVASALKVAESFGAFDGAHHKMWVIDQMVRTLTGCPFVQKERPYREHGDRGKELTHKYSTLGESPEYLAFVAKFDEDDEGEKNNGWDVGVAP